jgi:hypothetical protein
MRKWVLLVVGLAAAAVLAVSAIASANAATGSRSGTSRGVSARDDVATTTTTVSLAEAERIASETVLGGTVTEAKLATDNGRTVWNVHVATPEGVVEVKVDGETGDARIDDDNAVEAGDDRGRGDDDGSGHDANDDRGHGGDHSGRR